MKNPPERSPKIARIRTDAKAKRIRADLKYRKEHDEPGVYENCVESYRQDGYARDGYPFGYPNHLKILD